MNSPQMRSKQGWFWWLEGPFFAKITKSAAVDWTVPPQNAELQP